MKTPRMHIAVGTMLVGLAGCASTPSNCKPPRCYSNPGPNAPTSPEPPPTPTGDTAAPDAIAPDTAAPDTAAPDPAD